MVITDKFAIDQARANVELESLAVSETVTDMILRGLDGEYTTTDIINYIVETTPQFVPVDWV